MTVPIRIDDRFELYRVITDYEALLEGFIDRVEDLNVPRGEIDVAGEFTPGYASKLLCNPPIKTLGKDSFPKLLKGTGMALVLVIDDERFAPVKAQLLKRRRTVLPNGSIKRPTWLFTKSKSIKMQVLRNQALSPKQRKKIAKLAAKARWAKRSKGPVALGAGPGPVGAAGPVGKASNERGPGACHVNAVGPTLHRLARKPEMSGDLCHGSLPAGK